LSEGFSLIYPIRKPKKKEGEGMNLPLRYLVYI